ncbi:hypothetical protein ACKS0A_10273 [Histoplasma ohiense]
MVVASITTRPERRRRKQMQICVRLAFPLGWVCRVRLVVVVVAVPVALVFAFAQLLLVSHLCSLSLGESLARLEFGKWEKWNRVSTLALEVRLELELELDLELDGWEMDLNVWQGDQLFVL